MARRSASHSSSAGGRLKRVGASVAPGSISTRVSPHSTYVAIERTPSDSAASGMMFMAARPRPTQMHRPPSTGNTLPVIIAASSEARKRAAAARSSGLLSRPSGTVPR